MSTFNLDKDIFSFNKKLIDASNQSRSKNGITITIVPNGISELFALDGSNVKHNFIYGSAPNRGLQNVLESWGYIKSRIPAAILHVYYGFTDAFQQNMKKSMGEQDFNSWYAVMKGLLLQDGIEYHGSVNHSELTNAYRNAGFFLYPTHFQETGCISALRAMSCGCIPITSRLVESVLYDLTIRFDMGPSTPLTLSIVKNRTAHREWLVNKWAVSVVDAYHTDETVLLAKRNEMKRIIRKDFAWSNTALRMLDAF
jgi:glycosyltransferase involved in cell wall biosynthesis